VCLRAVLRGVGFARLPISLVMSYIEKGELETALDEYAVEVPGLMLYYPSRSQSLPKLRAFADFVQKRMRCHFRAGHYHFRAGDYLPTVSP
jgi:DNA-binding transcriptional LysR family regulator